ncbi:unnamed protein product [Paramecium sonneborni]|uniref:Uncharacterized protein n=1 Tax=Paramecium sonneborni TaxID=65129 RepID=A0A8S1QQT6_9CILI|nr:unnamed protein product [Paramecium sonneborni]
MCLCEINLFDIGVEECQIFDEAVPSGLLIQENLMYEEFCKFGQFKVLIENNRFFCLDCPKSVNNNLNCLDCYFNPETWYKQPKCTSDFVKVKNDENYGYLMQIRDEIEFETFLISELFQLMSTPYYQQICSDNQLNQDGNNCKLMNQKHLEKQLYAVCKDYTYYDQNQCIQCPLFCSKCNNNQCLNCVDHTYLYNGLCYECPKQCKECQYNIQSNMVECNQCYEYFGLVQGKCIECGLNCVFCMFWSFFDSYYGIWIEFLRCLQCIDNSKYHISSNGLDCKENQLQNCLHTYQTNDLYYYSSSTYDYRLRKFQNAINGCARCEDHFDVDQSGNCVPSENLIESCLFVYRYGNEETYCLISDYSWSQQNNKCFEIISNCQECILEQWTEKLLCILCQPGYYAHRLFGYCIQCPQELNCRVCSQQQTLFQDGWVYKIRSFYEGVMNAVYVETENTIPKTFRTAGQSQNIADYEVICNICQDGFQLHNNICILNCPNGCLECKIQNNQNICLKCQNDEYGRIQSLVDNKCLSCPSNCKLCTPRTFDQIKHLNPYFNDNKYQNFANRCVNSTGLSTFSYDPDFNFFINCESQQHLCQNVLTVSLLLYCDQEQYNQNLISQSDTQLKKLRFLKTTLFLDDLLNNSFQYFENDWFYSLLNRKQIRKLTIKILTQESQDCYFKNKVQIAQLFRSHVFSLNSVNLEFVGTQNNKFYIFDSVEFHNFTSISFEAINLDFKTSSFIDQQTVKYSIQEFKNSVGE